MLSGWSMLEGMAAMLVKDTTGAWRTGKRQVALPRQRVEGTGTGVFSRHVLVCWVLLLTGLCGVRAMAQDADQLNTVHVAAPPPPVVKSAEPPAVEGSAALNARANERIQVNVNLVLIPLTVTDPLDRLVTGLDKENFFLYEHDRLQNIKTFSSEDAPVSIGIILDLSGSMSSKFTRARQSVIEFMKTANPQDEFFVIGFNDRPEVITDFTNSAEDVDARLAMVKPGKRTALLDAIYMGLNKIKNARYQRKALVIVSDGGDNRSRYTESEVRSVVRESDVQMYAIGIFDQYAPTMEERLGPLLLNDLCEDTGGRMFRVDDAGDMGDIAAKISAELRNEYVLGYRSDDDKHDGKWRKVKVKLVPPSGLPPLTVHARNGYYAPLQ
jgi:Ca-activated chloride channel family protein